MDEPTPENQYQVDHALLLYRNFRRWMGKDLLEASLEGPDLAKALYHAPFVLMSHDTADDPVFNYCNLKAQELFEMNWKEYTSLPSRQSAEPVNREERARLLQQVTENNYIDNYAGVRISKSGYRFMIEKAVVFNLYDDKENFCGQSATFSDVVFL